MNIRLTIASCMLCLLAMPCLAGQDVLVRLVRVESGQKQEVRSGIDDVLDLLKTTVSSTNTYKLVASLAVTVPAKPVSRGFDRFTLVCSGDQKNFSITVSRGDTEVLKTSLELKENKPVVLRGLTGKKSELILILLAR